MSFVKSVYAESIIEVNKSVQGLIVETILTMILTQTILMTAVDTDQNLLAPLAIGFTLTLDIFGA